MKKQIKQILLPILFCCVIGLAVILPVAIYKKVDAKQNPFEEYYNMKCDSYAVQNANLSQGQIVFIGDSITDLYHLDDYYADLPLATYNRGIGGDTTAGVLKRMKVSLYDIAPSKIVLLIGSNDVGGRSVEYIMSNYQKILEQIKQNLPTTQVFCMSIISQNNMIGLDITSNVEKIKQLNPQIKTLAESMGYSYFDLFSLTIDENEQLKATYTDDGIHLNNAGFAVWTNLIKAYLA